MAAKSFRVEVHRAWWLPFYISGVWLTAKTMCMEPDMEKVRATISRGLRFSFHECE